MADFKSSQPVKSIDASAPVVISKDLSVNGLANPMYMQLSDGSAAVSVTGGALDVNISSFTATDLDIRDLSALQDNVAIRDGANQLAIDASGYATVNVNGSVVVSAVDLDIRDLTSASDSVEVLQSTASNLNATVVATDLDIRDLSSATDSVAISKDGSVNSETNPIYVYNVDGAVIGIEVISYDTASSVASDASDNHDYAVSAGKTLKVKKCMGSASSAQKIEIQAGPVASLVTQAVMFTSASNPNWVAEFDGLLEVSDASTGTVRIIRTNFDNQAQDLYSTIIGTEI